MTEQEKKVRRDRYYIRAYNFDWLLNGITSYLTDSEQIAWLRIQLLAANYQPPGVIPLYSDTPDPYAEIASSVKVRPSVLKSALTKLEHRGKVSVLPTCIIITNWDNEQPQIQLHFKDSNFDKRQKDTPQKSGKATTANTPGFFQM